MKGKQQEMFQVEVPETYDRLSLLAAKGKGGRSDACDCKGFHLSFFGKVILFFLCLTVFIWVASSVCFFVDIGYRLLFGFSAGVSLILTFVLIFILFRLFDRGWVRAHPDEVVTEVIPTYLHTQINYMETALVGNGSQFELVRREVDKVITKGVLMEEFIRRFCSMQPPNKEMPSHLAEMAQVAGHCLLFRGTSHLLNESELLVKTYLAGIRDEVKLFQKSLNAVTGSNHDYSFEQEVSLKQAKTICENLNLLSSRFNSYMEESEVFDFGSAEQLSKDDTVGSGKSSSYAANSLLKKLQEFYVFKYGAKPKESELRLAKMTDVVSH